MTGAPCLCDLRRGHPAGRRTTMMLPDGYSDVAPGKLAAVVTCLEMLARPTPRAEHAAAPWRLRREPRINAGTAQEEQLAHARLVSAVDEIVLDLQILKKELRGVLVVGQDATHFGRRANYVFGFLLCIESPDSGRVEQVQFGMGPANQASEAAPLQFAPDRAAHQAAVTGHINPSVSGNVHRLSNRLVQRGKQAACSAPAIGQSPLS